MRPRGQREMRFFARTAVALGLLFASTTPVAIQSIGTATAGMIDPVVTAAFTPAAPVSDQINRDGKGDFITTTEVRQAGLSLLGLAPIVTESSVFVTER